MKLSDHFFLCNLLLILCNILSVTKGHSQNVGLQVKNAFVEFEKDPQLKYAISSLYITEASTGNVIFEKNAFTGLAPASTQKIITSISALELMGKNYQYETRFAISKQCSALIVIPSGDPTFGSDRWQYTKPHSIKQKLLPFIQAQLPIIQSIRTQKRWNGQTIPDGWMWQDIGNYYGAGATMLNWRENQFDIILKSGKKIGDPVQVLSTLPTVYEYDLQSDVRSAATGSGDNAYVYFPVGGGKAAITGTIPINESRFVISATIPDGLKQFVGELNDTLLRQKLIDRNYPQQLEEPAICDTTTYTAMLKFSSPPLDSIIYWFNRKSINLYGEALVKTLSFQKSGYASTDSGVAVIKNLWKSKSLDPLELNIVDGSGLSPLNRVTTHAQVEILRYAKKQSWFSSFYQSLPEYNGMKMKSGTIRNVKGFCGYHTSKNGKEYVFSFLVNNYNGSPAALVRKMYKVLDHLK